MAINDKINADPSLASVIDGVPVGIVLLDRNLRIMTMNKHLEVITGYTCEQARGIECRYILRNNFCSKGCPSMAALREETRKQVRGNLINRDRELVEIQVTASPVHSESGALVGVMETIENVSLQIETEEKVSYDDYFGELIGHGRPMQKIKEMLPVVAATDSSILLRGETGSGKDLLASVIHRLSPRSDGPFIKVNCGALPETLLESELFGHIKGAFTGAHRDKPGRFQLAENGTIYLTEIGDLHLPLQVKLLTVLDDKEIIPVGGTRSKKVDVRVIAATHRDLESMVNRGSFRDDLLYRLNVVRIDIPPLRERGEDLRLLMEHFLKHFRDKFGKNVERFSREAIMVLKAYPYPGNVRELKNIVEYAVSICPRKEIQIDHLPEYLRGYKFEDITIEKPQASTGAVNGWPNDSISFEVSHGKSWNEIERDMISQALVKTRGNRTEAAKLLRWGRATLWRKMKTHGLI